MKLKGFLFNTIILFSFFTITGNAQKINLSQQYLRQKLEVVNRKASIQTENNKQFLRFNESDGEGLVWLSLDGFTHGEIEVKMRGKDVLQRSFIGIAFHGQNHETYDAVYCRPFNFHAQDSVRRIHSVQYISHPEFTWKKLREERNAQFEKEIPNAPDPNGWFVMKLVVDSEQITVYINNVQTAVLKVNKLSKNHQGKVGLFMGDGSGGDFEYIKFKKRP